VEFMERQRWDDSPACPRCGDTDVAQVRDAKGERSARYLWRCHGCKRQFTVRIGTVFEDSRIPLRHWCYAFWMAASSKKGVSALQIKRATGLSYKSALFMMHRIRFAMSDAPDTSRPLTGTVEADETYFGGKPRNPDRSNMGRKDNKACVAGFVERGGELRPVYVDGKREPTVGAALVRHVAREARLMTDESSIYRLSGRWFAEHSSVKHSIREYVRGDVHTNAIEGFFALLKRGIIGKYHSVSKKHLHRYLSEFEFRYNARKLEDGERTSLAIRKAEGKRLAYRARVAGGQNG